MFDTLRFLRERGNFIILSAKLHGPIDNIKVVKKTLNVRGVIYKDGVVFFM